MAPPQCRVILHEWPPHRIKHEVCSPLRPPGALSINLPSGEKMRAQVTRCIATGNQLIPQRMIKILIAALLLGAAALAAPLLGNASRNMACTQGFSLTTFYTGCDLTHPVNH
jgi:hypothetical protein